MKYDTREEGYGVWCQLQRGAHQKVLQSLFRDATEARRFSQSLSNGLTALVEHIVGSTAAALGQLVAAELEGTPLDSANLNCADNSMSLLRLTPKKTRAAIVQAICADDEVTQFWNEIQECPLTSMCPHEAAEADDLDLLGLVRLVTRMAGCCLGQALDEENFSVLIARQNHSASSWARRLSSCPA